MALRPHSGEGRARSPRRQPKRKHAFACKLHWACLRTKPLGELGARWGRYDDAVDSQASSSSFLRRLAETRTTEELLDVIRDIIVARATEPLPQLLEYVLFARAPGLAPLAAEAIRASIDGAPASVLVELDARVRQHLRFAAKSLQMPDEALVSLPVMGLTSFHPNGHVREKAVAWLAHSESGKEIPFLVLRMNDWVPQVRAAARAAMNDRLSSTFAKSLVDALPILVRMAKWARHKHDEFVRATLRLLRTPACAAAREYGLRSPDVVTRREVFSLAFGAEGEDRKRVVRAAMSDPDWRIRLFAAQKLRALPDLAEAGDLLEAARKDPLMPVRRDALLTYAKAAPPGAAEAIREGLFDRQPGVRRLARRLLAAGHPAIDIPQTYRDAISGPRVLAAIAGLGETGSPADAAALVKFASADRARIRGAAVRAIGALDPSRHVETLLAALGDESPRVSKEGAAAFERHPELMAPIESRLHALVDGPALPAHAKRNTARLLASTAKKEEG
jgi:hypothetical protein